MKKLEDFYFTGRDGSVKRIKQFRCTNKECGFVTAKAQWADQEQERTDCVSVEGTLGFYGPNGNGYTYWCRKCHHNVKFETDYSSLRAFLG